MTDTTSMVTPRMERTVCMGCHHFHRFALVGKCDCCRADYRAHNDETREQVRQGE